MIGTLYFFSDDIAASAGGAQEVLTFRLQGTHAKDTVGQVLQALGYNMTVFEPLGNGTIVVNATRLS